MIRKNAVVTCRVEAENPAVWIFNVLGAGELRFDTKLASERNTQRAAMHGWKQRIADAAAISRDEETNAPATPQMKLERMQRLVAHYESGSEEWSARLSGAGAPEGGMLMQVLRTLRDQADSLANGEDSAVAAAAGKLAGKSDEQLSAFAAKLKPAEKTKLLNSNGLRPIADALRAKMAEGVDADELLSGLEEIG